MFHNVFGSMRNAGVCFATSTLLACGVSDRKVNEGTGGNASVAGSRGTSDAGSSDAGAAVTLPGAGSSGSLSSAAGATAAQGGSTGSAGAGVTFGGAPAAAGASPGGAGALTTTSGCVAAVGTIADLSIDDLEDGDNVIQLLGGRSGFWYTFNDRTPGAVQVPAPDAFKPTAGGHSVKYSAETSGTAFTAWAGMGFDFNNTTGVSCPYDASAYTGITFWAKGNVALKAMVKIPATTTKLTAADSNTCVSTTMCNDHYFLQPRPILTATWTEYTITFADSTTFAQEGWGIKVPFDKMRLIGVQFQVAKDTAFDFAIDDVTFF